MQQNDKNLCILFETECWLYISEELSPERKEFWDSHISSCTTCASHLESSRYVSSVYTENCTEDIPDTVFNKVIESLPVKKSFWDKCRPFFTEWKGYYAFTKIAFACVLLIAAFSKILLTDKPIPIKEMTAQVFKWDDDELSAKI